jgi:hypothetical protein
MRSSLRAFFAALILAVLGAGLALAQGTVNFNLLVTENGISNNVPSNSTIPVTTGINTQSQVTVVATYTGPSAATITQKPQVLGSTEFTVNITSTSTGSTALPIVLGPSQSLTFVVTYAPTSSAQVSAQVQIPYTEPGTSTTTVQNAILLLFQGTSPAFTLFYVFHNNSIPIPSGGTIPFGATQINTTASAGLIIQNTGSGPGTLTAITQPPASSPFQIAGIPPIPSTGLAIAAGTELNLVVQYTPTAIQNDTAQITITFLDGTKETVNFSGNGIASAYTYSYLNGTGTTSTPVAPGGTITFLPVNVATAGTTTTPPSSPVIVQVKNSGSASGTISSISVSGQGFTLVTPPTTAPVLAPGGLYSFTISYTPTQVGTQTGTLVVNGSDVFTLSGQGLGSALTFSYTSPAGTIPVVPPNAVIFSPVAVSKSESVTFTLTNSGTLPTTISSIGTSSTSSGANPFSLTPAPTLPLTLMAGKSTQFMITFTPVTTGFANGILEIDNTSVPLLGSGTAPPALPSYTFTGPSGNASPASQANIGLTLANPYPVDLTGVLTLTTSGNYGTDQAVQFEIGSSTGNRTVDFTIPAGSTSADFVGQGSLIGVQTGTVAETVTLAPTFTTTAGLDVTPSSPPTLQFTIAAAAPVVESVQVSNITASSFDLLVVGYSTTRSLTSMSVTFTPASGYSLSTSQFTLPVDQQASVWFQSTTSTQSFGGLFEITVPFNLPGTIPTGKTLVQAIASAAVTVSNAVGTSSSLSAPIL